MLQSCTTPEVARYEREVRGILALPGALTLSKPASQPRACDTVTDSDIIPSPMLHLPPEYRTVYSNSIRF